MRLSSPAELLVRLSTVTIGLLMTLSKEFKASLPGLPPESSPFFNIITKIINPRVKIEPKI
jgi:hypothetical protein